MRTPIRRSRPARSTSPPPDAWLSDSALAMLRWTLTGLLAGVLLAACGSRPPDLQPPTLRIVELQLDDGDTARIRLRVRNPVAVTLPAHRLAFTVSIEERELGRFVPPFDLDVPALGNELIEVEAPSPPAIADLLRRLEAGELARAAYRIEGELVHSDGASTLPVENRGWLTPTPGKPGSFR